VFLDKKVTPNSSTFHTADRYGQMIPSQFALPARKEPDDLLLPDKNGIPVYSAQAEYASAFRMIVDTPAADTVEV